VKKYEYNNTFLDFSICFYSFFCCARHLAAALELLQWILKYDGFSSKDKPRSFYAILLGSGKTKAQ
jgi:hypothetical protein